MPAVAAKLSDRWTDLVEGEHDTQTGGGLSPPPVSLCGEPFRYPIRLTGKH